MLRILHGSDLHFGKPYDPEVGRAFQVAARKLGPDLIVLSGDLTQRAKVREYRAAREYLDALPRVPTVVTPGNHDVPLYRIFERLFAPFRNYREWISEDLDTVTLVDGAVVVSLNTAAPRRAIVNGRLRARQIDFARKAYAEAPVDDTRILVAHHHFAPAPDYEVDRPLPGAKSALDAFESMGVELILGGHLHRAFIGNSLDIYAGEDRDHGIVIVQSGTTTSHRGRAREQAKNSFNVVVVEDQHLEITHHMYFEERGAFAPFSMHAFPRPQRTHFQRDPFRGTPLATLGPEPEGDT
jgi:3',5'-cyclic AMP phosphodiesterase CpdA